MQRIAILAALAFGALIWTAAPGVAAPLSGGPNATTPTEHSAQSKPRRSRTSITVQPRYPYRTYHSPYPLPYAIEYPGPNAKRECVARYVQEARPSGTVIVPRMRCWWVAG